MDDAEIERRLREWLATQPRFVTVLAAAFAVYEESVGVSARAKVAAVLGRIAPRAVRPPWR